MITENHVDTSYMFSDLAPGDVFMNGKKDMFMVLDPCYMNVRFNAVELSNGMLKAFDEAYPVVKCVGRYIVNGYTSPE